MLDWSKAALVVDEKQLLQLPYMLRKVSSAKVLSLRLYTQFIWETYFSSVRKIIMTTLEVCVDRHLGLYMHVTIIFCFQIIKSRIEPQPLGLWNGPPGHFQIHQDFSAYPFDFPSVAGTSLSGHFLPFTDPDLATTSHQFTAVVIVTRPALRESSSLLQMLHILAQSPRLASVVLLWAGIGPPKVSVALIHSCKLTSFITGMLCNFHCCSIAVRLCCKITLFTSCELPDLQVMTSKFKLPIVILKINLESRYTKSLWLDGYINTSAILYLHEDTAIITEEVSGLCL